MQAWEKVIFRNSRKSWLLFCCPCHILVTLVQDNCSRAQVSHIQVTAYMKEGRWVCRKRKGPSQLN
jgi:hypothetical protein